MSSEADIATVGRKGERDIDVMLAEEFSVSPSFVSWFLAHTKFSGISARTAYADISIANVDGESDLLVVLEASDGRRLGLLIEDKIDAPFMPEQRERYERRGARGVKEGLFSDFDVVLCAPLFYFENQESAKAFARYISYEAIANHFNAVDSGPRAKYRAAFLRSATSRRINAWKRTVDHATERFWQVAYEIASREFPTLEMKPLKVTQNSRWIKFTPHDFPSRPRVWIHLKGSRGIVDLAFGGTHIAHFHPRVEHLLSNDMTTHQTGKSTSLRLLGSPLEISETKEPDLDVIRDCFTKAARLVEFFRNNQIALIAAAAAAADDE